MFHQVNLEFIMRGYYSDSDNGDITTVNSYNLFDYSKEIPVVDGNRTSDLIDCKTKSYTLHCNCWYKITI